MNAIVPIAPHEKPASPVRLIYSSSPQRGLVILYPVFCRLAEKHPDIELEVFSSFKLYGWDDADAPYRPLFEQLAAHPRIRWHGARPNAEVREALQRCHVLAYPSIWAETSGIALMEAMSAGLLCVHPNLGALYETAAGFTQMYQWSADKSVHADVFARALDQAIDLMKSDPERARRLTAAQSARAGIAYNWDHRAVEWETFLRSLIGAQWSEHGG